MNEISKLLTDWEISKRLEFFGASNSEEADILKEKWKQNLDLEAAKSYLEKYWLPHDEYRIRWWPIQNQIFTNQYAVLPQLCFLLPLKMFILRGGGLFSKHDFAKLQYCMKEMGNQHFVIIENTWRPFYNRPGFRMKYPINISWQELMSGNFISVALFEVSHYDYFVFSEAPTWGKYADNEVYDLDIVGFLPEYEHIFKKHFEYSKEEEEEVKSWKNFPSEYRNVEVRKGAEIEDKDD